MRSHIVASLLVWKVSSSTPSSFARALSCASISASVTVPYSAGSRCPNMLRLMPWRARIFMKPVYDTRRFSSALVSHQLRKEEHDLGHVGHAEERGDHDPEEGQHLAHEVLERDVRDLDHHEEQQAVRRRDETDHDVDHDDNAEVHRVDPESARGGEQDRNDDEQDRGSLEEA